MSPGRFYFTVAARAGLMRALFQWLFADDDDAEGAWLHFATAFAGRGCIKFGGRKKDGVRFQVEAHGAGATLCGNVFDDGVFVWGILMDNGEVAIAAGREDVAGGGIKTGGVGAIANCWS